MTYDPNLCFINQQISLLIKILSIYSIDLRNHFGRVMEVSDKACREMWRTSFFTSDETLVPIKNQLLKRRDTTIFTWQTTGRNDAEGNCDSGQSIADLETGETLPFRTLKYYYKVSLHKIKMNIVKGELILPKKKRESG